LKTERVLENIGKVLEFSVVVLETHLPKVFQQVTHFGPWYTNFDTESP